MHAIKDDVSYRILFCIYSIFFAKGGCSVHTYFYVESRREVIRCPIAKRIKEVKQPHGGYLRPRDLETIVLGGGLEELGGGENAPRELVAAAVDHLGRFVSGDKAVDSFLPSMLCARALGNERRASLLMNGIRGLDDVSIENALLLSGLGECRAPRDGSCECETENAWKPNAVTVVNARIMTRRTQRMLSDFGGRVLDCFTFDGGYTETVCGGTGDLTTPDTLWLLAESAAPISTAQTLRLLMCWRMGVHSHHDRLRRIEYLALFNARKNTVSRVHVASIPQTVASEVDRYVIGY